MKRRMISTTITTTTTTTKIKERQTSLPHRSAAECLVACNIYISAGSGGGGGGGGGCGVGGGNHYNNETSTFLLNLLKDAQTECSRLRRVNMQTTRNSPLSTISSSASPCSDATPPPLTVVHAYSDGPYNRSSFHLAGTAPLVTQLATTIAIQAFQQLSELQQRQESTNITNTTDMAHPTVGLVDHISILPLFRQHPLPTMHPQQQHQEGNGHPLISREEWIHACTTTTTATTNDSESTFLLPVVPTTTTNIDQKVPSPPSNDKDDPSSSSTTATTICPLFLSTTGWVARTIGHGMNQATNNNNNNNHILYYGQADPPNFHSLAHVRKHSTRFFRSGSTTTIHNGDITSRSTGNGSGNDGTTTAAGTDSTTVVGAPNHFVENYNIQVAVATGTNSSHDNKKNPMAMAQSLTKHVRSKEGLGLPHVEALTLPYGFWTHTSDNQHDRNAHVHSRVGDNNSNACPKPASGAGGAAIPLYEVACNLLNPSITSATDIDRRVQEWLSLMQQQEQQQRGDDGIGCNEEEGEDSGHPVTIVRSYRVGTTVDMCLQALETTQTLQGEAEHNAKVLAEFETFLYN